MKEEILDYIGLHLDDFPKQLIYKKPDLKAEKTYDNLIQYKVYKKVKISDIVILLGNTDRTMSIKERYELSMPVSDFIKENRDKFDEMLEKTSVDRIKELEKLQDDFEKDIPYFIKYEKNYIWQIYYSEKVKKYIMLFPGKEGETETIFYLIKEQLTNPNKEIFVPICKMDYSDEILNSKKINDIENYIWVFTKKWCNVFEVYENKKPVIYIVGETALKQRIETKFRIVLKDAKEAEDEYALLKALFVLTTETNYKYSFEPAINEQGTLIFKYNNKEVNKENLQDFLAIEANKNKELKNEIKKIIDVNKQKLAEINKVIDEQTEVYQKQEHQILMFTSCRKNFFRKIRFFLRKDTKLKATSLSLIKKIEKEEKPQIEDAQQIESKLNKALDSGEKKTVGSYTIADLVRAYFEAKVTLDEEKNVEADIKAAMLKKENLIIKIKNAGDYLDEIESHKKSIFEFWKYANKDKIQELGEGKKESSDVKIETEFKLDEDLPDLAVQTDRIQRNKLTSEEFDAIYASRYLLNTINNIILDKKEIVDKDELKEIKKIYSNRNTNEEIFGSMSSDYTNIKILNNKKHREANREIASILHLKKNFTEDEFIKTVKEIAKILDKAYDKIKCSFKVPVYYTSKNEGFIMGEINPYKLLKDSKNDIVYKFKTNRKTNMLFMTNMVFYNNINKTLPLGMDESTQVLFKEGEVGKGKTEEFFILIEDNLFKAHTKKIKMIEY